MLEAKGLGYEWALDENGDWWPRYDGASDIQKEMDRQVVAAEGRAIEWHCAHPWLVVAMQKYVAQRGYTNVTVIYTPQVSK